MNKRVSRNGINNIARDLHDTLQGIIDGSGEKCIFDAIVVIVANMFEADNEAFDRDRFFKSVYFGQTAEQKKLMIQRKGA